MQGDETRNLDLHPETIQGDLRTAEIEGALNALAIGQRSIEGPREADRRAIADLHGHADDRVGMLRDRLRLLLREAGVEHHATHPALAGKDAEEKRQTIRRNLFRDTPRS